MIEAILLAIIQGIAEFFPISSSGHLMLAKLFFGLEGADLLYSLVLNLGTTLAIIVVLWPHIKALFFEDRTRLYQILVALIPLFPIVFLLKPIKTVMGNEGFLGLWFVLTAVVLFIGEKVRGLRRSWPPYAEALLIGLVQAFAVMPGLSRLGLTVSMARVLGWSRPQGTLFSFLLAVPVAFGAAAVEGISLIVDETMPADLPWINYVIGFFVAFGVGVVALKTIIRYVRQHTFLGFALYCLFIGLFTLVYFNF